MSIVKVELSYNPYVMDTAILFNGQKPRINSLVEKYVGCKLQDWMDLIPAIFHDEMNGYGFELEFAGPELEYQQLRETFESEGIADDEVVLIHKQKLVDRIEESKNVDHLLEQIKNSKNTELFDYGAFVEKHKELLSEDYSIVLLNGQGIESAEFQVPVTVEQIDSLEEITDVDLRCTPIVINISKETVSDLQANIESLKKREDIKDNQLFFIISSNLNIQAVKRTVSDLGIHPLTIVESLSDKAIEEYLYAYPVTEHLNNLISELSHESECIQLVVEERRLNGETLGENANKIITDHEYNIKALRNAADNLREKKRVELPGSCYAAQNEFLEGIQTWQKRKVKINEKEAKRLAVDFDLNLFEKYSKFFSIAARETALLEQATLDQIGAIYKQTGYDSYRFIPEKRNKPTQAISIRKDLLKLGTVDIKTTTYSCRDWRNYAHDNYLKRTNLLLDDLRNDLNKTLEDAHEAYVAHVNECLEKEKNEKDAAVAELTLDGQRLQRLIDWDEWFADSINELRRGNR